MATAKEIEQVILKAAGNPSSGPIADLAPVWAQEIAELDKPKVKRAIVEPEETR
jgi:hypothetical protein